MVTARAVGPSSDAFWPFPNNIPAPGWSLEIDLWELVDGLHRLRSNRATGECGHRTESLRWFLVRSLQRPNLVSGVPLWIADPNVAGGKRINKAAFATPTGAVQGNLGRNALRGFGATQVDLTLRRQYSGSGFPFRRERISSTSSTTPILDPQQTTSVLLYSGNRPRCWEHRSAAAASVAASIRCIKSEAPARRNWPLSLFSEPPGPISEIVSLQSQLEPMLKLESWSAAGERPQHRSRPSRPDLLRRERKVCPPP